MTAFAALTAATERRDTDELAIARGEETLRIALSILLAGLGGGAIVDVTETGLPAASADAKGKLYVDHQIPAAWIVHETPQTLSDPQGAFFDYAEDQAVAYTAATRARNYDHDITLGFGSNRRAVATAATVWIIDGTRAVAYDATSRRPMPSRDIALGAGDWVDAASDGTTVWFVNADTNTAVGYDATNSNRAAGFDIALGSGDWAAAVCDGTTLWFVDNTTNTANAYLTSNRQRRAASDINLGAGDWTAATTDDTTLWFVDNTANYARARSTNGTRNASHDINLTDGDWVGAACDETTVWFIRDEPSHNFSGGFSTDAAATAGGWTTEGEWYYNTSDRVGYRLDRVSGSLRRQQHSMSTLLGANHIWLGHGRDRAELLRRITEFDAATTYVGEVGDQLLQLYGASYVMGSDGHTIYDWQLAFGLGTPVGLPTTEIGQISASFTIDEGDWHATGITLPTPADAEWVIIHVNNGEWHFNRVIDYTTTTRGTAGDSTAADEIWDQFLENAGGFARWIQLGIAADGELLVSSPVATTEAPVVSTLEVRALPLSQG